MEAPLLHLHATLTLIMIAVATKLTVDAAQRPWRLPNRELNGP